jgi:hypothetical protein
VKQNGCTLAALVSAMLNIINQTMQVSGGVLPDYVHLAIGVILALATLVVIWRIDVRRNNGHG